MLEPQRSPSCSSAALSPPAEQVVEARKVASMPSSADTFELRGAKKWSQTDSYFFHHAEGCSIRSPARRADPTAALVSDFTGVDPERVPEDFAACMAFAAQRLRGPSSRRRLYGADEVDLCAAPRGRKRTPHQFPNQLSQGALQRWPFDSLLADGEGQMRERFPFLSALTWDNLLLADFLLSSSTIHRAKKGVERQLTFCVYGLDREKEFYARILRTLRELDRAFDSVDYVRRFLVPRLAATGAPPLSAARGEWDTRGCLSVRMEGGEPCEVRRCAEDGGRLRPEEAGAKGRPVEKIGFFRVDRCRRSSAVFEVRGHMCGEMLSCDPSRGTESESESVAVRFLLCRFADEAEALHSLDPAPAGIGFDGERLLFTLAAKTAVERRVLFYDPVAGSPWGALLSAPRRVHCYQKHGLRVYIPDFGGRVRKGEGLSAGGVEIRVDGAGKTRVSTGPEKEPHADELRYWAWRELFAAGLCEDSACLFRGRPRQPEKCTACGTDAAENNTPPCPLRSETCTAGENSRRAVPEGREFVMFGSDPARVLDAGRFWDDMRCHFADDFLDLAETFLPCFRARSGANWSPRAAKARDRLCPNRLRRYLEILPGHARTARTQTLAAHAASENHEKTSGRGTAEACAAALVRRWLQRLDQLVEKVKRTGCPSLARWGDFPVYYPGPERAPSPGLEAEAGSGGGASLASD